MIYKSIFAWIILICFTIASFQTAAEGAEEEGDWAVNEEGNPQDYVNYLRSLNMTEDSILEKLHQDRNELDKKIKNDPENPYLWFRKGINSWGLVYAYSDTVNVEKYKLHARDEFRKSINFNIATKKLTYEQLSNMWDYVPLDIRPQVSRSMLTFLDPTEYKTLELKTGIVGDLINLDRYDEARAEMDAIALAHPEFIVENPQWRTYFETEIQKRQNQVQNKTDSNNNPEGTAPEITTEQPLSASDQGITQTDSAVKTDLYEKAQQYKQWIFILLLLAIVIAVVSYIKRRSRK